MTHDEIKFKTDLRQDLGFGQMDPSTDGISETETDSTARSKLMRRRGVWYYYFFYNGNNVFQLICSIYNKWLRMSRNYIMLCLQTT